MMESSSSFSTETSMDMSGASPDAAAERAWEELCTHRPVGDTASYCKADFLAGYHMAIEREREARQQAREHVQDAMSHLDRLTRALGEQPDETRFQNIATAQQATLGALKRALAVLEAQREKERP